MSMETIVVINIESFNEYFMPEVLSVYTECNHVPALFAEYYEDAWFYVLKESIMHKSNNTLRPASGMNIRSDLGKAIWSQHGYPISEYLGVLIEQSGVVLRSNELQEFKFVFTSKTLVLVRGDLRNSKLLTGGL